MLYHPDAVKHPQMAQSAHLHVLKSLSDLSPQGSMLLIFLLLVSFLHNSLLALSYMLSIYLLLSTSEILFLFLYSFFLFEQDHPSNCEWLQTHFICYEARNGHVGGACGIVTV